MEKTTVIWSEQAKYQFYNTLLFYLELTQTTSYIDRLEEEVNVTISLLKNSPMLGRTIKKEENIRRVVILSNFSLYYKIIDNLHIEILTFWDNRRDPESLKLK